MEERDLLGKPACASLGMNEFLGEALNTYSLVFGRKQEFGSISSL